MVGISEVGFGKGCLLAISPKIYSKLAGLCYFHMYNDYICRIKYPCRVLTCYRITY